jgi:hypothetical protein
MPITVIFISFSYPSLLNSFCNPTENRNPCQQTHSPNCHRSVGLCPDDEVIWRAGPVSGHPFDSLSFSSFHSERGRFGTRSELAARNRRRGGIGGLGVKGTGRTRRTGVEGGTGERFSVIVLHPMIDLPITSPPPSSPFSSVIVVLRRGPPDG